MPRRPYRPKKSTLCVSEALLNPTPLRRTGRSRSACSDAPLPPPMGYLLCNVHVLLRGRLYLLTLRSVTKPPCSLPGQATTEQPKEAPSTNAPNLRCRRAKSIQSAPGCSVRSGQTLQEPTCRAWSRAVHRHGAAGTHSPHARLHPGRPYEHRVDPRAAAPHRTGWGCAVNPDSPAIPPPDPQGRNHRLAVPNPCGPAALAPRCRPGGGPVPPLLPAGRALAAGGTPAPGRRGRTEQGAPRPALSPRGQWELRPFRSLRSYWPRRGKAGRGESFDQ